MSDNQLATLESLTPDDVLRQIQMVQQLMAKAMKDGTHYGSIPGTGPKKNLLKPGADKLCLMFRLAPTFPVVESIELPNGHREVKVQCTLTQITTGRVFSQGVGSCSTMESKYRYRTDVLSDEEGNPQFVPGKYWSTRDPELLGGPELTSKKIDKKWVICRKVEIADLADVYNTVLKMAKKRAYVDATISATAASDIFTQDLEDTQPVVVTNDTKDYESVFTGLLTEAQDRPAKDKSGNDTGGFVYFAKIGTMSLWTKEPELGSDLMAANGSVITAYFVPTAKSNRLTRFVVKEIRQPEVEEPDDIPG